MYCATKITVIILISFKIFGKCCDCNLEGKNDTSSNDSMTDFVKSRQANEYQENENIEEGHLNEEDEISNGRKLTNELTSNDDIKAKEEESNENYVKKLCRNYKMALIFDLEKMADVWQIVYYKAKAQLSCFKIHIRKISVEDRRNLYRKFGDFHHAVDWQKCRFEIVSSSDKWSDQKHFLQGTEKERGVFENVILSRTEGAALTLIDQSPDQWLIIKNLLLMRDCDNGDVVVFSRVPAEATLREIKAALIVFGEEANGRLACEDNDLSNLRYHTLS